MSKCPQPELEGDQTKYNKRGGLQSGKVKEKTKIPHPQKGYGIM